MKLSIVTTMYRSAPYLLEFYGRVGAAAKTITDDYEIVFVNDGSPDDSLEIALKLYRQDARIRIVDLSRNFGHHKAIMTGLAHARGDLVFLLDCDLEEDPEVLERFSETMMATGADVVYGVQGKRAGGFFTRYSGGLFYSLFNLLSSHPVPRNVLTARLMTKRYVANLVQHRDRELFLLGLLAITGFEQVPVICPKHPKGTSVYTLPRKIALFVNAITSFSNTPLVAIFYLGCAISVVSTIAAAYLVARWLFQGLLLAGWASLIVSVWLMGGMTILCLGIIGIYLSKVFIETKERPYTVIRQIYYRQQEER
ncbi:MAG TPA: glycosyltransferase family 2 protein [Candidatus Methylomirabilis sp.]|nr:glycosyltransferase family 2 protein [Candidatus Methylomirabilis sp.]